MLLEIEHHLHFTYDEFIRESHMEIRVEPRSQAGQIVHDFRLTLGPSTMVTRFEDWLGNAVHWFSITDYHERIEMVAQSVVDTTKPTADALELKDPVPTGTSGVDLYDFTLFTGPVMYSDALDSLHADLELASAASLGDCIRRLGDGLAERFEYMKNITTFDSTTDYFMETGAGVCQDFAHLGLALLRRSCIPSRYVSGYLHVDTQDIEPSQSHAWIEFFSPSNGWTAFDPTHNRVPDERYVIVGYGRTYNDVPPNRGIYSGTAEEHLDARVITTPVLEREHPRLVEESQHIDLPVYRELPGRDGASELTAGEAAASQQQQQQ